MSNNMSVLAAAGEVNPLVPHLSELILGLVVFGILVWLVKKYVSPLYEKTYVKRVDEIEGGLKRAEEAQAKADAARHKYEEQLAQVRTEAALIRENARSDAQAIKDEMRQQAQDEVARIRQRGEVQLAAQRDQVVRELRGEVGQLAVSLASRLVGDSLADGTRRSDTVDRFLDELDGMSARSTNGSGGASAYTGGTAGE